MESGSADAHLRQVRLPLGDRVGGRAARAAKDTHDLKAAEVASLTEQLNQAQQELATRAQNRDAAVNAYEEANSKAAAERRAKDLKLVEEARPCTKLEAVASSPPLRVEPSGGSLAFLRQSLSNPRSTSRWSRRRCLATAVFLPLVWPLL